MRIFILSSRMSSAIRRNHPERVYYIHRERETEKVNFVIACALAAVRAPRGATSYCLQERNFSLFVIIVCACAHAHDNFTSKASAYTRILEWGEIVGCSRAVYFWHMEAFRKR